MSKLIAGKLAFVTGAGSGIGREVCRVFAREGANVIATDQNVKTAEETVATLEGAGHVSLEVQVTDRNSIETAFKDILKQFSKPPTIIVNSAGITRDNFLVKLSDSNFDDVMNVNLRGTFLIMQTAVKAMIEANATKDASIINISSIVGKRGNIGQSNYSASKAGVVAMTKSASMEFGQFGIRVNAVQPGFIDTPITATVPDKVKEYFIKNIPLQRLGKPQEVAEVIAFLASDKSSYVNGASIEVTGGMY
ncbi:PREDICTED: estradiol 17-beta-dehydrogenase 8 [Wasmannia auropunctata]|uniref:estradiol 17-beta-dehydrogenase 8 n=1 Tax=Wasmannia auropunctata TaxID=64793 RepID=UPI0005ED929D|nr:PREDICTED: estradiol 17-beta-dehydrogenase 8 [Wasmannia auropunctata]XP_011695437.1 PREDICTED: estradiol 17-beta-dehydrogenase 8 [Wasmannia auropunctata]XP_011695438.1 PREDICTED: estradiol 17-beta-dehydrogenase 8 [Wasmannia auropunctata]